MSYYLRSLALVRKGITTIKSHPGLQYLFILALVLRLCYLMFMLGQVTPDELMKFTPDTIRYVNTGRELLDLHIIDEGAVFIFGPGYGAFLALVFFFFGVGPLAVLLIQVLLSSISCLLIYKLGKELTGSKAVGYVAGILSATSFTSISLSVAILSDSLFFFLFLLGNLLFLIGFRKEKRSYFIWSGIIIGLSILIRSIGQFWPAAMIVCIAGFTVQKRDTWLPRIRSHLLRKAMIAPLTALCLMSIWIGRNYNHYDTPLLALTSAGGPANVAALTVAKIQGCDVDEIRQVWIRDYQSEIGKTDLDYIDQYRMFGAAAKEVMTHHLWEWIDSYFSLVWENVNSINEIYRIQLPQRLLWIWDRMSWLVIHKLNFLNFWLSMAGFMSMLIMRKWRAFFFLGILYLYFVSMVGFTRWQGSRLFYPSQIAWSIAIAVLLVNLCRVGWKLGSGVSKWTLKWFVGKFSTTTLS